MTFLLYYVCTQRVRDVTAAVLVAFSPLGTKLYFHVKILLC